MSHQLKQLVGALATQSEILVNLMARLEALEVVPKRTQVQEYREQE